MKVAVFLALFSFLSSPCPAKAQDPSDIVARSMEATERDWVAAPQYDYFERDRTEDGSKTYQVIMIEGSPYNRLTAINGEPLDAKRAAEEERKLQDAVAKRKAESPDEKAKRISEYQKDREQDHALMKELTRAFDFTLQGEEKQDGFDVYVLDAEPRPDYRPSSTKTQVLTGMKGTLWIDKRTFQWVKVEAEVTHPVSIEHFVAEVQPGTRFELEKMPVSGDVWLPRHFSMTSRASILFFFHRHRSKDETYCDYRLHRPLF